MTTAPVKPDPQTLTWLVFKNLLTSYYQIVIEYYGKEK
jgi:hypothetical protein